MGGEGREGKCRGGKRVGKGRRKGKGKGEREGEEGRGRGYCLGRLSA